MRSLQNKPNVEPPDSDYPFGRIKDKGVTAGTPVNEVVYGDMHQFFEKLVSESGITPNELPDNDYNGFQIFEAFISVLFGTSTRKAFKRIEIGNWNMFIDGGGSATNFKNVAHGITKWKTISVLAVTIIDDGDIERAPLNALTFGGADGRPAGGVGGIGATNIMLNANRYNGSPILARFNADNWDDNTINRGYIDVLYEP